MAKVEKISGINIFLSDDEAGALASLLNWGLDYSSRRELGLADLGQLLNMNAPYFSVSFGTKATIGDAE
jgi:hypothetical protein